METRDGNKYLEYCKIRNKVRSLTRKLQKEFEKDLANQTKKKPNAFWQYYKTKTIIKPGIGKLNVDPINPKHQMMGRKQIFLQPTFYNQRTREVPTTPRVKTKAMMQELTITETKILLARLLVELSKSICHPLWIIFEMSIKTASIPINWKEGKTSAIYKNRK